MDSNDNNQNRQAEQEALEYCITPFASQEAFQTAITSDFANFSSKINAILNNYGAQEHTLGEQDSFINEQNTRGD